MADAPAATSRTRGLVLLFAIFLLGMICGAALFFMGQHSAGHFSRWRMGPGMHGPHDPIGHLARELDLDDEQLAEAREILDRNRRQMHEALERTHEELMELLTPDQRERFGELRLRRHGPRRRVPGPPPPPPAP